MSATKGAKCPNFILTYFLSAFEWSKSRPPQVNILSKFNGWKIDHSFSEWSIWRENPLNFTKNGGSGPPLKMAKSGQAVVPLLYSIASRGVPCMVKCGTLSIVLHGAPDSNAVFCGNVEKSYSKRII